MITGLRGASIWSEDLPGLVLLGDGLGLGTHSEVRGRLLELRGAA